MKTFICFICAVITTSALAALQYSGVTYEVEVVRDNGSVSKECIRFHENGRFTMSGEPLVMRWATEANFSDRFMAVTAPGEHTVVPYHQGVYGAVFPDKTLKGHGIDQGGSTFEFHGRVNNDCYANRTAQAARNANQIATDRTGSQAGLMPLVDPCWTPIGYHVPCDPVSNPRRDVNPGPSDPIRLPDPCQMADGSWTPCDPVPNPLRAGYPSPSDPIRLPDPCQMADGSWTPCDPVPNPLRSGANNVTPSTLTGRSFRLTLGTSEQNVLEYCWTFGQKRQLGANNGDVLTWSANSSPDYSASFRSVGAGENGRGMAYHGTLVGYDLLKVVGIEARDGVSVVTYGFGQQVESCPQG